MSNREMTERLESLGKSVEVPERKVPKRKPKLKKPEQEDSDEEKGKRIVEKMKKLRIMERIEKMKEEKDECKHKFEIIRPELKRLCIHCGEESTEKIFLAEKKDLLRYQLTFKKDD